MTKAKTVKVRIAVAVDDTGEWVAVGRVDEDWVLHDEAIDTLLADSETRVSFVEAIVPIPPPPKVVKGKVAKGAKR